MTATTTTHEPVGLVVGGDRITSSSVPHHEHIFPGTGRTNAVVAIAGASEIDRAVACAWEAHREWAGFTVDRRRDLLIGLADVVHENLDELAALNVHDYAVPVSFAGTAILLERFLRHFAGYADKPLGSSTPVAGSFDVNLVEREPYGVVGVIAPWNGALAVAGACVAPALAAGNAVVFKPSELAPLASPRFGELCLEAGLPPGLVNIVPAGPEGGEALVRHPGVRKVHFTGGAHTARAVVQAAAANLTPVVAELGGKSASIVFADADLDAAAMLSAHQGPLMQSGQSCACASRLVVHESVYDAFVERFLGAIDAATVGDPFDSAVTFGPVISAAALDRIRSVIDGAVAERSGELLTGGSRIGGELSQGFFIEPTVFGDVDNSSNLAQIETFGPVVSVIRFRDDDDALRLANDTPYGLNAFVHTRDLNRAHSVARRLEAGSVWINTFSDISPQGPYGGYKQSGFGRTGGIDGLHEFLQIKNIRIGMG